MKSGALDLSKPGNMVAFMPKRPAALVDAKDDRITLAVKIPSIASNRRSSGPWRWSRRWWACGPSDKDDHLDVHFKADLGGVAAAVAAARNGV